jgi:type IX secretion system PorP/SprF family membrane protein
MKMKCFLVCIFCFVLKLNFLGQQTIQLTQWSIHQLALNPAISGIKQCPEVKLVYRNQYTGLFGAPQSGVVTFSFPINRRRIEFFQPRHGVSLKYEYDKIGPFLMNRFNLGYAMHINFTVDRRISFGVYGGIRQFSFNRDNVITINPDPAVAVYTNSLLIPDFTAGAWWNDKNYYIGATLQNLTGNRWTDVGKKSKYRFFPTINAGYKFIVNDNWSLLPAALIKFGNRAPLSMDLQTMADFNNAFAIGLGYRNVEGIHAIINFKVFEKIGIAYSIDIITSKLRGTKQTHEFSLSYSGCTNRKRESTACPLFE